MPPVSSGLARNGRETSANERIVIEPTDRYRSLVEAVNGARRSLDLSVFRCDDPFIIEILQRARLRGVRVRVLLTNRAKGGRKQLAWLESVLQRSGIDVTRYRGACHKYHAKYALIDGSLSLVSSMNVTRQHFTGTDDVLFVSRDRSLHRTLAAMFESDWLGHPSPIVGCDRLIVSPDNARARFANLIASARRSIVIVDHKLADLAVLDQILAARSRGVAVQLITDRTRFGVRAHGKFMIIDDNRAVIGSLALAADTLDHRRDVAVIVNEPYLVRQTAAHVSGLRGERPHIRPQARPSPAVSS